MNPRHLRASVFLALGLAFALAALSGCPATNTPQPSPPSPNPATGFEPPPGDHVKAAAGAACGDGDECASGICEGEGCGDQRGVCADVSRACTKDLREYCGCDGKTFGASGSCPGRRFAATGACVVAEPPAPQPSCPGQPGCPPQADGAACLAATDCTSGVCEGQGCGTSTPGVCAPKSRRCTRDRRAYCGCDGKTFFGSGTCPGQRYATRNMCPDGK